MNNIENKQVNSLARLSENVRTNLRADLRIIWAIATKDIVEALKNKTILTNIILLPLLIVFYKWLPTLYHPSGTRIVLYDPGPSRLAIELANSPAYRLYETHSQRDLAETLDAMPMPVLGLAIPAGFDRTLDAGQPPVLEGYVMNWVKDGKAEELKVLFERQFAEWTEQPIWIDLQDNTLIPFPDTMGPARNAAISIAVIIVLSGLMIVPLLMIEEKRAKTLDAMLISPANATQVVVGKAVVGLFYGLATAAAALLVNCTLVVHWGTAILTALIGLFLSVAIGLAMGTFFERKQQVSSWGMLIFSILLIPVFLNAIEPILPKIVQILFGWMPAAALAATFRLSFSNGATPVQVAAKLAIPLVTALIALTVVAWQIRRSDL
ncbi:MAG: ABC transporter permease [Anaerolineae bacterium]|nr:ABC transporter permease [Anaerolineae bacterium]